MTFSRGIDAMKHKSRDPGTATCARGVNSLQLIGEQGEWKVLSLFWDAENHCYDTFPAPVDRFGEPQFPDLKPSRIYRLAFRDKRRLIDSPNHPLFLKWAARDQ
jgi:hypothetical protein